MKDLGEVYLSEHPRQPWRQCPYCGALHDGVTGVNDHEGATVTEGNSILICIDCGQFGILDSTAEGGWRKPTKRESRKALDEAHVVIALAATRTIIERRNT